MSLIDPFSEGVFVSSLFNTLTQADALPSNQVTSSILAEWGERSFHVFGFAPSGAGTPPDFTMQGQVSNDFVAWQNVEGMLAEWKPSVGQLFGNWGVRVANSRLPSVRTAALASGQAGRQQAFRWLINATGGSDTWSLNRAYTAWLFHKGSAPEENSGFQFMPGKPARLLLDWT